MKLSQGDDTPKHLNAEAHTKQTIYIEYKTRKC